MISAHPDAERSTKEAGADHFVAKPFDVDDLLLKVKYCLQQNWSSTIRQEMHESLALSLQLLCFILIREIYSIGMRVKVTVNHNEIKEWAKKYKGKPELLSNTETETGAIGIRIDFPGKIDDMYLSEDHHPKHLSWDDFFKTFEAQSLAFEYEDGKHLDDPSAAYHFIRRDSLSL